MDIWIILDGEKKGPLHDFEIRRKIETGELPGDTHAWHEGMHEWKPLREIGIFAREFEPAAAPRVQPPPVVSPEARITPPPLPVKTHYIRRFWARWLDLSLYVGVWWFGMWAARQDIEAVLLNGWILFFRLVPWFIIEIFLIHHLATTPGKWLLGLRVLNKDGSKLSLSQSVVRAMGVLFIGIGFGWFILAIFCQTLSYFTAKRLGTPLWDHVGGHQVTAKPLNPFSILAFVFLFFGSIQLQSIALPYMVKILEKTYPELKGKFKDGMPPHLPERS